MAWTYEPSTAVGKVRLLMGCDRDPDYPIMQDEELEALLEVENNSYFYAAADALDAIASNEAYVLKVTTALGLSTNGPAVAAALRDHARSLRERGQKTDDSAFDVAEMVVDGFSYDEYLYNLVLRNDL